MAIAAAECVHVPVVDAAALVEQNQGLVHHVINRFFRRYLADEDDLVQEGLIGLWKAIQTHDPEKGQLSTWACKRIRWRIDRYLQRRGNRPLPQANQVKGDKGEDRDALEQIPAPEGDMAMDNQDLVARLLRRLPARWKDMVAGYFGVEGHEQQTLDELAAKHGVTKEGCRQMIKTALLRLRPHAYDEC